MCPLCYSHHATFHEVSQAEDLVSTNTITITILVVVAVLIVLLIVYHHHHYYYYYNDLIRCFCTMASLMTCFYPFGF